MNIEKIQVKRGVVANLPTMLDDGEPFFTLDTHQLFFGQGGDNYEISTSDITAVTGILYGNGATIVGATAGNFPTLNQNTSGTAAGLTAQYINWSSSSGGASIANKPTLGTIASQAANNVSITGGSITGITDLAVADGGTGLSSVAAGSILAANSANTLTAITSTTATTYLKNVTGTVSWGALAAAGLDTQVQFNDAGVFAGSTALTFNKLTSTLSANYAHITQKLSLEEPTYSTGYKTSFIAQLGNVSELIYYLPGSIPTGTSILSGYSGTSGQSAWQWWKPPSSKRSVRVATTANITLENTQTIDGVAVANGERVLVKNQTLTKNNGLYVCVSGVGESWVRATDADTWEELIGAHVYVEEGTSFANTAWRCSIAQGGTLGTTAVTWKRTTVGLSDGTLTALRSSGLAETVGTKIELSDGLTASPQTSNSPTVNFQRYDSSTSAGSAASYFFGTKTIGGTTPGRNNIYGFIQSATSGQSGQMLVGNTGSAEILASSAAQGFGLYGEGILRSTSGYAFGAEINCFNLTGATAPLPTSVWPAGYTGALTLAGYAAGTNSKYHSSALAIVDGSVGSYNAFQSGIVFMAGSVNYYGIDFHYLGDGALAGTDVVPIRLANDTYIKSRNAADNADVSLIGLDGSNVLQLGTNTNVNGTIAGTSLTLSGTSASLYLANKTSLAMKDVGGTYRSAMYWNDDAAPGSLVVGQGAGHLYLYIEGAVKLLSVDGSGFVKAA